MSKLMLSALVAFFLIALLPTENAICQESYSERKVIGEESKTAEFRQLVKQICDPATKMIPDTRFKRSNVYLRLTNRTYVFNGDKLNQNAALGGSPYVFLTVPQVGFGRSLYEIYSDLGYDAEGVLKQRNKNMVAIVFRYKSEIKFSSDREGHGLLDKDDFDQYVYVPTWKNAFTLLSRLAGDKTPNPKDPFPMKFSDESSQNLARFFPAERRKHLSQLPYSLLRMAGGPDWEYRQLLESKMSMNSHFRGVGITENTLSPADNRKGVPEFIGPNRTLDELLEYAVIDVGRMEFKEVHN